MAYFKNLIFTVIFIIFFLLGNVYSNTAITPLDSISPLKTEEGTSSIKGLELLGTILESNSAKSIVVIKDINSGKQGVYKIGDKISGYQLAKIARTKILLLKDGKYFLLEFPLGSKIGPIVSVSSNEKIVHRQILTQKIPDLNAAMMMAIPLPYIESGKFVGFKIVKLKDKTLADIAGLKEGDVITKVNGQKLNTLHKPFELLQNIRSQNKISVEIKRGEQFKNLMYYIN